VTIRHLPPDPAPAPHTSTTDDPDTRTPDPSPATGTDPTGRTDPASSADAIGATADEAAGAAAWLRMSAALSAQVPVLAEREDVTVTIAPGAGRGAPGCFVPALATIELDTATFTDAGLDPATAHPDRPTDRDRYPAAWGVFTHECAHARHSHWHPSDQAPPPTAAAAAAALLEESRIEAAHLTRRPGDRRWLRAAATALILPEFPTPDPDTGPEPEPEPDTEPAAPSSAEPASAAPLIAEPPSPPAPIPAPRADHPGTGLGDAAPSPAMAAAAPLAETGSASVTAPPGGHLAEASAGSTPGQASQRWAAAHAAGLVLMRATGSV
jgi:hypothetical protein